MTAYRVDEIRTLAGDPLKNATVVVREGVIEQMGLAVVIPDHAEVIDLRGTGATITPPLALSGSRFLTAGSRGGQNSRFTAVESLRPAADWAEELLKEGVLIVGIDPPGSGMPGRSSVLHAGRGVEQPLVRDLHLTVTAGTGFQQEHRARRTRCGRQGHREGGEGARGMEEGARGVGEEAEGEGEEGRQEGRGRGEERDGRQGGGSARCAAAAGAPSKAATARTATASPRTRSRPRSSPRRRWIRTSSRWSSGCARSASPWCGWAARPIGWHWLDPDRRARNCRTQIVLTPGTSSNLHEVKAAVAATGLRVHLPAHMALPALHPGCA